MKLHRFDSINESARKNYGRENFSKYPYQMYFSDGGMADAVGAVSIQELINNVAIKRKLKEFAIFRAGPGFHSTADEKYLVKWYDETDSSYWFNRSKKEPKLTNMRIVKLSESQISESDAKNTKPIVVKFKRWTCVLEFGQYNNGRTAIELIDKKNGEPVMVATVNIPEAKIEADEIIIKDYSENEGILEILVNAGVISKPSRTISSGYIEAPVCKLLVKP